MAYNDRALVGVHGWLAFLAVVLGALTPITAVISVVTDLYSSPAVAKYFGDRFVAVQACEWGVCLLSIAGCWYLAWRISKVHTASTPRIVITGLWLLALGRPFLNMVALGLIVGQPIGASATLLGQVVRPAVWAAIWTAYLLRSRRVANTYTDDANSNLSSVFE